MDAPRRQLLTYGALTAATVAATTLARLPAPRAPAAPQSHATLALRSMEAPDVLPASTPVEPTRRLTSIRRTPSDARRAFVHNLHTGEVLNAVYYANGAYSPEAMLAAMRVLRDWRNGEEHHMDPRLFDVLHTLNTRLEVQRPFQIISGYRSPATNAMLHAESGEVASRSQHLLGKALDVRIEGVDLARLHRAALSLGAGGVGYYPQSDFVHLDVGPVRQWSGT